MLNESITDTFVFNAFIPDIVGHIYISDRWLRFGGGGLSEPKRCFRTISMAENIINRVRKCSHCSTEIKT